MKQQLTIGFIGAALAAALVLFFSGWRVHFRDLEVTLKLTGITSPQDEEQVGSVLRAVPGVYHVEIDADTGVAECFMTALKWKTWSPDVNRLRAAVTDPFHAYIHKTSYSTVRIRE